MDKHETRVTPALVCRPTHPFGTLGLGVRTLNGFGMKGKLFLRRGSPISIFCWTTPSDRMFGLTPIIRACGFLYTRSRHLQGNFKMVSRIVFPNGGDGVVFFSSVIIFFPSVLGIIVDKDGRVPTAVEFAGTPMEHFRAFIKQYIPTFQNDFVCIYTGF
jgi:hypothetical protein